MDTGKKDNLENEVIKEAYNLIQPQDSWEALKNRVEKRVFEEPGSSVLRIGRDTAFWRRLALALAACLVITSGLLFYVLGNFQNDRQKQLSKDKGLLDQGQLDRLGVAFSHVRELFGTPCPWMVIDSGGEGEIGVNNRISETADSGKIIVIRLAVNIEGREIQRHYLDVVAFSNQQVSFNISVAEDKNIGVSIKPFATVDGRVTVEMNAKADGGTQKSDIVAVADNKFTSLARIKFNDNWISIDATGQLASNI